jgi:hypothetical protein
MVMLRGDDACDRGEANETTGNLMIEFTHTAWQPNGINAECIVAKHAHIRMETYSCSFRLGSFKPNEDACVCMA